MILNSYQSHTSVEGRTNHFRLLKSNHLLQALSAQYARDTEHSVSAFLRRPSHLIDSAATTCRKFNGKFKTLVFAGQPSLDRGGTMRQMGKYDGRIQCGTGYLIIVGASAGALDEYLVVRKLGKGYSDQIAVHIDATGYSDCRVPWLCCDLMVFLACLRL